MSDSLNKKFAEILGKIDQKALAIKMNKVMEMLKDENYDELKMKLKSIDKKELLQKLSELDASKLTEMNIDKNDVKKNMENADMNKLSAALGENGDEIIKKIKDIINN